MGGPRGLQSSSRIDVFKWRSGAQFSHINCSLAFCIYVFHRLSEVHIKARRALFVSSFLGHCCSGVFQTTRSGAEFFVERKINKLVFQAALTAHAFPWFLWRHFQTLHRGSTLQGFRWGSSVNCFLVGHRWNLWSLGLSHVVILPKFHKLGFLLRFHISEGHKMANLRSAHRARELSFCPLNYTVGVELVWAR